MQQTPIFTLTRKASAAVAAHRFITFAGAHCGAGAKSLGVSGYAAAIGADFAAHVIGTAKITSGAAFATDVALKSDAAGKAIATGGTGHVNAYALEAATAADQIVEVLLVAPGYAPIA